MSEEQPLAEAADAERQLAALSERARRNRELRTELWRRLDSLTATEVGPQGMFRVTVGSGGELTGLELAESTRSLPPAQLSGQIMACMRRAQATLAHQVARIVTELGTDDPVTTGIASRYREQFPEQPAPPPDPPMPGGPQRGSWMRPPPQPTAPQPTPSRGHRSAPPPARPRTAPVRRMATDEFDDEDFSTRTFLTRGPS